MKLKTIGLFNYSLLYNISRFTVELEEDFGAFYRKLCPQCWDIQKPKFPPHISIVRELNLSENKIQFLKEFHYKEIEIIYNSSIYLDHEYVWLNVYSNELKNIRSKLNLEPWVWYTKPPDNSECFHITIGNFKKINLNELNKCLKN